MLLPLFLLGVNEVSVPISATVTAGHIMSEASQTVSLGVYDFFLESVPPVEEPFYKRDTTHIVIRRSQRNAFTTGICIRI